MSVYMPTNAIHYKTGHADSLLSKKRASACEPSDQREQFLSADPFSIENRSGKAIMNSPPIKISEDSMLRPSIVRHYVTTQEQSIWRYLLRPGKFFFMWLFFGLLALFGMVAWYTQVPIYADGVAAIVEWKDNNHATQDEVVVVAFLPVEELGQLETGQNLYLPLPEGDRLSFSIMAIEPGIVTPQTAQSLYALTDQAAQVLKEPAVVVRAHFEPDTRSWPALTYTSSVYRAEVEVGSRSMVSLLPVLRELFKDG